MKSKTQDSENALSGCFKLEKVYPDEIEEPQTNCRIDEPDFFVANTVTISGTEDKGPELPDRNLSKKPKLDNPIF